MSPGIIMGQCMAAQPGSPHPGQLCFQAQHPARPLHHSEWSARRRDRTDISQIHEADATNRRRRRLRNPQAIDPVVHEIGATDCAPPTPIDEAHLGCWHRLGEPPEQLTAVAPIWALYLAGGVPAVESDEPGSRMVS